LVVVLLVVVMGMREQQVDLVEEVLVVVRVTLDHLLLEHKVHILVTEQQLDMLTLGEEDIIISVILLMVAVAAVQELLEEIV
jgi:hypothetical protein